MEFKFILKVFYYSKVPVKVPNAEEKKEKAAPVSATTPAITSALAGLFEARHPWAKEGGLESGLGFNRYSSGGLLGIRSGFSKLPSFKVLPIQVQYQTLV